MSDHVFFNQKTQDSGTKAIKLLKEEMEKEIENPELVCEGTTLPWDLEDAESEI